MFAKKAMIFVLMLAFCACLGFAGGSSDSGKSKDSSTGASSGGSAARANNQPDWIRDPYAKFDKQSYVAARGNGNSLQAAEKSALGNLVAVFGQSIMVSDVITTSYQQAISSGVIANWSENTNVDSLIATSAGMDTLIGAEIGDSWDNGKGEYYALAVLNKTKALATYSNMIQSNQAIIKNLVGNLSEAQKNSLDGFARYQFAATIADISISYGNVLSVIGAPAFARELKPGDDYRLEALNITKTIPIGITVKNDKSGRVQGAFAKVFSEMGFRSGGSGSRYILNVNIIVSPVDLPANPNQFVRMELSADLVDTASGVVLLPYNFNERQGHNTVSEAENRTFLEAERKIARDYKDLLSNYLSQLLPRK